MGRIEVRTLIGASAQRCFDLARSQAAHVASTSSTGERIVAGPAHDLLELGDLITFEARHFGVRQRLTAEIVEFDRPVRFVDEMQNGAFKSFRHEHRFSRCEGGTEMVDEVDYEAPFGPLGYLAERLFLTAYLQRFLARRGATLRSMVETAKLPEL